MIFQKNPAVSGFLNVSPHSILAHSFMISSSQHAFILKQTFTFPWPRKLIIGLTRVMSSPNIASCAVSFVRPGLPLRNQVFLAFIAVRSRII